MKKDFREYKNQKRLPRKLKKSLKKNFRNVIIHLKNIQVCLAEFSDNIKYK